MKLTDRMLLAEAMLVRELRRRFRARPAAGATELRSFSDIAERSKLAGIAQAIRAIRRGRS